MTTILTPQQAKRLKEIKKAQEKVNCKRKTATRRRIEEFKQESKDE